MQIETKRAEKIMTECSALREVSHFYSANTRRYVEANAILHDDENFILVGVFKITNADIYCHDEINKSNAHLQYESAHIARSAKEYRDTMQLVLNSHMLDTITESELNV